MEGDDENPGLNFRMLEKIFDLLFQQRIKDTSTVTISVSYVEIYNEELKDLLISRNVSLGVYFYFTYYR